MRNFIKAVAESLVPVHAHFRRVAKTDEHGDVRQEIEEISPEEYLETCRLGTQVDFLEAMDKAVPDVNMVDKFTAMDRLNLLISGIQYEPEQKSAVQKVVEKVKDVFTIKDPDDVTQ